MRPALVLRDRFHARTFARVSTIVLALALTAAPGIARADEAAARVHFRKGIELYDKKHYADALAAFQEAYKEKPSAGIKQNIALSLKGLNRFAEAATALDEALEEGKSTLKPETRAAIERELTELSKSVATVNLTVVTAGEKPEERKPVEDVVISVLPAGGTPQALPQGAHHRPLRLMPGIYTFSAHAPGYPDPPEKKLALVSGAPVDATFVMSSAPAVPGGAAAPVVLGPNEGRLKLQTNVPDATIRIDSVDLPYRGTFDGKVSAGVHKVQISAPGWKTTTLDIDVPAGASVDQPVKLQAIGEAPAEYMAPRTKVVKPKRLYVTVTAAVDAASYRLGVPLDEPAPYGTRRPFVGVTLGGRIGYLVSKTFAVEGLLEVGGMNARYKIRPADQLESETTIAHWQLTPMVRFVSPGKVRFTAATGFGLHGLGVEAKLAQVGSTLTKRGSGTGFSWVADAGMQFDVGPVFLEAALFLNVHGVGPVRDDDPPEDRFFYASPSTRGGLRLGLGIPF